MKKAIVNKADGLVLNVIEIEPDAKWKPSKGAILIDALNASPGDTWDGENFIKSESEPTVDYKALWKAAKTPAKKLKVLGKMLDLEELDEEVNV